MSTRGYSLIEVIMAAAIIAVGLTAATALVGTLMQQQELNAATLRAANLQEQAAKLYRLDLRPDDIYKLLPEKCQGGNTPPGNGYALSFSRAAATNITVNGTDVVLEQTGCIMIFANPGGGGGLTTNGVTIVRPSIRVKYNQN
jgi:prepilin-type N-terminal cleavage/methylation domain-containing protein